VLNIFPSIDTGVCATSVRKFNQEAANLPNTVVLCVSKDLPFAQKRFCGAEGIDKVQTASWFRGPDFGKDYGVTMRTARSPACSRARSSCSTATGKVVHSELVPEIAQEPNYAAGDRRRSVSGLQQGSSPAPEFVSGPGVAAERLSTPGVSPMLRLLCVLVAGLVPASRPPSPCARNRPPCRRWRYRRRCASSTSAKTSTATASPWS
jgi:peroxiredoxin